MMRMQRDRHQTLWEGKRTLTEEKETSKRSRVLSMLRDRHLALEDGKQSLSEEKRQRSMPGRYERFGEVE